MGGLVSPGPRSSTERGDYDEKRGMSIEVPAIVLTAPHCPSRTPSPPPKSILLLPPTSLPLPIDPTHPTGRYSQSFAAVLRGDGRGGSRVGAVMVRSTVLLLLLAGVGWHLWSTTSLGPGETLDAI